MKRIHLLAVAFVALCVGTAPADDISTLYNTGVDNAGTPLPEDAPDSHWSLVAPGAQVGSPLVQTAAGGFPVPPWLGDSADSAWITTLNPTALGPTNVTREYHYQTTFSLAGFDPTTAAISGQASQDNTLLDVLINGSSAGISESAVSFGGWSPFSFDAADIALLNGGDNTLTFIVQSATLDGGDDYTSVRVEFLEKSARLVPEPSSLSLLGLGGLALLRRRK